MKDIKVEICCGSYYDAIQAYNGGANRIELNSALFLGGLTPSIGTLSLVKKNTDLEVIAMVRPRGGGFNYNEEDFNCMKEDTKLMLENGADGIAFGCLDEYGNLDYNKTKNIVSIIKKYKGIAVFHRAFDLVDDPNETMKKLIELGVDRVLTSGLEDKAINGISMIKHLNELFGNKIEILPGSGINHKNVCEIIEVTGVNQIHSSCKNWINDSTSSALNVSFDYDNNHKNKYDAVDKELVEKLINSIRRD